MYRGTQGRGRGRAAGGTPYMTCYDASADTIQGTGTWQAWQAWRAEVQVLVTGSSTRWLRCRVESGCGCGSVNVAAAALHGAARRCEQSKDDRATRSRCQKGQEVPVFRAPQARWTGRPARVGVKTQEMNARIPTPLMELSLV